METEDAFETEKLLNERDWEILRLCSTGLTNQEIADKLDMPLDSLTKYLGNSDDRRSIYRKIRVSSDRQAINWYFNKVHSDLIARNKVLQVQNAELTAQNKELQGKNVELKVQNEVLQAKNAYLEARNSELSTHLGLATQLLELATQHRKQFLFLRNVGIGIFCILIVAFLPFLPPSTPLRQYLLNVYIVVPLVFGLYGVMFYRTRLESNISFVFCIMSLGLICWFWGGFLWFLLDIKVGLESHYLSVTDFFYFLQTLSLAFSFPLLWNVFYRRNQNDVYPWLVLAVSLFIGYNVVAFVFLQLYGSQETWLSVQMSPLETVNEVLVALADSIGLAFAICLLRSRPLVPLSIPLKSAIRLISWGMVLIFAADLAFHITNHLHEDDPLYYGGGGPLDLIYLLTFCLLGLGIVLGSTSNEPIEEQLP